MLVSPRISSSGQNPLTLTLSPRGEGIGCGARRRLAHFASPVMAEPCFAMTGRGNLLRSAAAIDDWTLRLALAARRRRHAGVVALIESPGNHGEFPFPAAIEDLQADEVSARIELIRRRIDDAIGEHNACCAEGEN